MCTLFPHSVTPCVHFSLIQSHHVYTFPSFSHTVCTLFSRLVTLGVHFFPFSFSHTVCTLFSRLVAFLSFSLNGYALFSRSATLGIHLSLIHWFSHTPLMLNTVLICFSLTLQNFQLLFSKYRDHIWWIISIQPLNSPHMMQVHPALYSSDSKVLPHYDSKHAQQPQYETIHDLANHSQSQGVILFWPWGVQIHKPSNRVKDLCQTDSLFFRLSMLSKWHIVFPNLHRLLKTAGTLLNNAGAT